MDANNLGRQVNDLVQSLTARETDTVDDAIAANFAADAQLTTPIKSVKGADKIRDVLNLHRAFASQSTPGPVNWDESNKTATLSMQTIYSLGNAPWPFSMLRRFSIPIKWADIKLYLQPDESHPVRSDATEPTKYQVSRISTVAHPPKNKLIAAAYSVIMFTARIVAPFIIDSMVVIHKFFNARRPQLVEDPERVATNVDVPSSPPVLADPLSVRKSTKRTSVANPVQEPVPSSVQSGPEFVEPVQEPVNENTNEPALNEQRITEDNVDAATAEVIFDHDGAKIDQQEQAEEVKEAATLESEVQKVQDRAMPEDEQLKAEVEDEEKVKVDAIAEATLESDLTTEEKAEEAEETNEAKTLEDEVAQVQAHAEPEPETKLVETVRETNPEDAKVEEPVPVPADITVQQRPADHNITKIQEDMPAISETKETAKDTETEAEVLAETVETDVNTLEVPALNPGLASTDAHVPVITSIVSADEAEPKIAETQETESKDTGAEKPVEAANADLPDAEEAKPQTLQPEEAKPEETQAETPEPEETLAEEEAKVEETKAEDAKTGETQAEEAKIEEVQAVEVKPVGSKAEGPKPEEIQAEDVKVEDTKVEDTKVEDTKVEDTKVEDTKVEDTKVEDTKVEDTKVEDTKVEEIQAEDVKVEDTKVEDTKVEDTKVEDTKVEDTKVEDTKVEDTKVEDTKVEEVQVQGPKVEEPEQPTIATVTSTLVENEEAKRDEPVLSFSADKVANRPAHNSSTETVEEFPAPSAGVNAVEEPSFTAAAAPTSLPDSSPSIADNAAPRINDDDSELRSSSPPGTTEGSVAGDLNKKKNKKKKNKNKNKNRRLRSKEGLSTAGGNE
ncbi:hypothetical protein CspeluHIS016_0209410 [Cutaneotrichosporon spelunceum]|uniref:Uncharacterized protein n=1 Tax=Cutaneotrichosporon spelunceum TaxID=1672016 RepID=A0AAD3TT02_9TREE|nr:hypothetical protein CspeluHIS016_0209410 [Cutaneotrichosporon spelunceum]